jgi:hypothetical protein
LASAVDDWVFAAEIVGIAARTGLSDPSQLRQLSIGLVSELLVQGLVVAGEYDGDEHRPWQCSTGEAIAKIAEVPTPGPLCGWFSPKPAAMSARPCWLGRPDCSGDRIVRRDRLNRWSEEIQAALSGSGAIIGGFCNSGACLAPYGG